MTEIAIISNETAYPLIHNGLVTQPSVILVRGKSSKSYIDYMPIVHYKIHNSIPSYSSSRPQIFRLPWYSVLGSVVDLRDLDMLSLLKVLGWCDIMSTLVVVHLLGQLGDTEEVIHLFERKALGLRNAVDESVCVCQGVVEETRLTRTRRR